MGVKAGLDPSLMCDVINAGSGMNTATTQKFPRSVLPGTFDYGFGMALMVKDVRLFLAEAEDFGIPVEVAKAVGSLWETAMDEHGERSDFTELAKTVEKRAGVQMRAKKKVGSGHERRHLGSLCGPLRRASAQGRGELHRRRSARRAAAARLFRLGHQERQAHLPGRHRLRPAGRHQARPHRHHADQRRPEAARRRARQGRGHHHQPHALRPLRQHRYVPARPLPRAGQGDALLHRPLHVPQAAPQLVRRGLRGLDAAQGVRRPRHASTTA